MDNQTNSTVDQLLSMIMPIVYYKPGQLEVIGTGFIISPHGLMITARHVIEEIEKNAETQPISDSQNKRYQESRADLNVFAVQPNAKRDQVIMHPIISTTVREGFTDIGVCQIFNADRNARFDYFNLEAATPKVGDNVFHIAYRKMKIEIESMGADGTTLIGNIEPVLISGSVIEVFKEKRDNSMLHWPSFCVNTLIDPGMSGGPIFRQDTGIICGVNCSGLDTDASVEPCSYGSSIWPIMAIEIKYYGDTTNRSLWELAKDGIIQIEGDLDRVKIAHHEGGGVEIDYE